MSEPLVIAIDGPAASGKGTLARRLADYFHLPHLDTGLTYRAVAHMLIDKGWSLDDEAHAIEAARQVPKIDPLPPGLGREDIVEIPINFKPE